jgi:hypothetical protein
MTISPVATATLRTQRNGRWFTTTWRFDAVAGPRPRWRGARVNAKGVTLKSKDFYSEAQLRDYLDWLLRHGWRVNHADVMPARPVRVKK